MWGTNGAGLRTTLENWVTLRTRTRQRERAIQGHKGGSAGTGTGPRSGSSQVKSMYQSWENVFRGEHGSTNKQSKNKPVGFSTGHLAFLQRYNPISPFLEDGNIKKAKH
ncbi:hypothetical protein ILYODFUR_020383 [Ilyodon furcidens]|uniref:Uncharacterized protein n=1 Tax=Ilyodon furcidens TaxID=33524 RepID=A0ABV0UVX5_9TELE